MAQGAITAKLVDISITRDTPVRVVGTFARYQEDSDGVLNTIESQQVTKTYTGAAIVNTTVGTLKTDLETLAKAANSKLQVTIK